MNSLSSRERTGHGAAAAARLLALLAVVLGLLAMHGLVSSHHGAAAVPGHVAGMAVADEHAEGAPSGAELDPGSPAAVHTAARTAAATTQALPGPGSAGPDRSSCDGDCPQEWAAACVVALAAAAGAAAALALAHAAARRPVLPTRPGGGLRLRAPAPPQQLRTSPDPVAELCVSRT